MKKSLAVAKANEAKCAEKKLPAMCWMNELRRE